MVAVFVTEGEHNAAFDSLWRSLPDAGHPRIESDDTVDVRAILPNKHTYYAYDGSFTTPPCTEGVKWVVLAEPVSLSRHQIDEFRRTIDGNNRPVQPLNNREIRVSIGS